MPQSPWISRILFSLALVTLLIAGAYQLLPEKHWEWLPDTDIVAHIYADEIHGGNSSAQWIDEGQIHFSCELEPNDRGFPPFCGFHVHFDTPERRSVDLSNYQRMVVDIDYQGGNEKLRLYLSEYVPGFSDPDDPITTATTKYLGAYAPSSETQTPLTLHMDEFLVADWWVNNNNVPRHLSTPSRENVMLFGVDIAHPSTLGHHQIRLNSVTLIGPWVSAENWYLGIVIAWATLLAAAGLGRIYILRRYASELQGEKARFQSLSMTDPLTGLLNRQGLTNFFEQSTDLVWPMSLVLVDIDYFKPVNDTYGHEVGDQVLSRVAQVINAHSRQSDRATRWGGEEFLLVLPGANTEAAYRLAERLRQAVMAIQHPELDGRSVTISIGIAPLQQGEDFKAAFNRADQALYAAKGQGRNCVVCAD
ncbi:GGDEF domain-containing protein [Marinimicrobium alkaliphilum]|uniref:GGDEF domain-containing protein n=1 Tax=Marinimicrobium alkaliphilum TaxID=2202654 RepID=UPI001300875C|nr:GGDEF domain-containing protein [Marinimicrobium alkaliphilum]